MDDAAVLSALPHAVLVVADSAIVYANAAAHALAGRGDLVGQDPLTLVHAETGPHLAQLVEGLVPGPLRLRLDGRPERWVAVSAAPGPGGSRVLSVTEVTEQVLASRRLERSEQRFRAAFEAAAHGSALVARRGRILAVNSALAELLGRDAADVVGRHVGELLDNPALPAADWSRQGTVPRGLRHADGSLVHVHVTTSSVVGDDGEALSLVQVQDVTERRRSEQRLRHLALHDQLTDLPSRNLFLERLRAALEQRTAAAPIVAVLFADLDEFKLVNDALGHAVGDLVLQEAAFRLRSVTRPPDTVARLSGDEFVVVCPALATEAEALAIADRLSESLRAPVLIGDDEVLVSASIGVAFTQSSGTTAEELLRDADTAMYRAKQLGRRRYEVFDSALRERAGERARLRTVLSRALAEDRVVVHYQPLVALPGRRVVALEALLRVRDDDGSLLAPDAVLDIAAEAGLLRPIEERVVLTAARAVRQWGLDCGRPLGLAVNLCAAHLDAGLPTGVRGVLAASGLPAEQLFLDVTEQTLTRAGPGAREHLQEVRGFGVRVALDDFGTGWGSLTYLRELPLSLLKVDRSFVGLLPDDPDGLVRTMVALAGQLGLDAVAEGVETEEQLEALAAGGLPAYGQGLLFGPPVPGSDVPAELERLGVADGPPAQPSSARS